ncbi:craniofacial development protein 2-like [Elysia marginata]|uniref:Craniofacial development protein 2-like n=1 Tax=Elysia marginata TaxID=1093978 RepID=A0AAV4EVQ0_9GAST|nr:craniofacial development protein 2-like [Elysia marginata]
MGNLNAQVGDNNRGDERTMGQHGCGSINNNDERLVEFCAANDLVNGGTLFKHPAIHKLTWYSPYGHNKNQIDHIAINGNWRGSMLDVRVTSELLNSYVPNRSLRPMNENLLAIPTTNLKLGEIAFSVGGPMIWNNLESHVRKSPTMAAFMKSLRQKCLRDP